MKKIKEALLIIIFPAICIILSYIAYDFWTLTRKPVNHLPVMKAISRPFCVVGPVIPHENLAQRKFVVFEGKEINEKEFTRVLILDIKGDGIEICGVRNIKKCRNWMPGNSFDFNNDGIREKTPLIGEDDAILLYRPQKNNDLPKNGADVIGTYFVHKNLDAGKGAFSILRNLANGKDYLEKDDNIFKKFRLWTYGEKRNLSTLKALADIGVEKISLVPNQQKNFDKAGNILGDNSVVEFSDGRKTKLWEVWLKNDLMIRNITKTKLNEKTIGIPDINGYAGVPSLRDKIENSSNGELGDLVRRYLREPNFMVREALLLDILYKWSGVFEANPMSRISEDGINYIGDARKLMVLEKFIGRTYIGTHSGKEETPNPHKQSVAYVLQGFREYANYLRRELDRVRVLASWWGTVKVHRYHRQKKWDIDLNALKDEIKKYAAKHETYQTKLLLTSFYEILNSEDKKGFSFFKYKTVDGIIKKIKGLGLVYPKIDLKDFGEMVIKGTVRGDILFGRKNDDNIFIGAEGDDSLNGGAAEDIYIYGLNDGIDVITEIGGYDKIMFLANIDPERIVFEMEDSDFLIKINGNSCQAIRIKDYAAGRNKQIEELVFADGRKSHLSEIYLDLSSKKSSLPMSKRYLKI